MDLRVNTIAARFVRRLRSRLKGGVNLALGIALTKLGPLALKAPPSDDYRYYKWLLENYPRYSEIRSIEAVLPCLSYRPRVSIVIPLSDRSHLLERTLRSLEEQAYPDWEAIVLHDPTTPDASIEKVQTLVADGRFLSFSRPERFDECPLCTEDLRRLSGEWFIVLEQDSFLAPDALFETVLFLNHHPSIGLVYTDEDVVDASGRHRSPRFKQDWFEDSYFADAYIGRACFFAKATFDHLGGLCKAFEDAWEYDLVLRIAETGLGIGHVPKLLYHGPAPEPPSRRRIESMGKATLAALQRREEAVEAVVVSPSGRRTVRYSFGNASSSVAIIVPTRDLGTTLDTCLHSIFARTTHADYRVIVVDNGSKEQKTFDVFERWSKAEPQRFVCLRYDHPFNYSKINNFAVEQTESDYLLFLNNDTEVLTQGWVEAMVEQAQRPSIGAVGALLLYPNRMVQHAGVLLGLAGVAGHAYLNYRYRESDEDAPFLAVKNYSAVTAACLMCRREVFNRVHGFEERLSVGYNDVDLCLKMIERGLNNLYLPHVRLFHYESKSRGADYTPEKKQRLAAEAQYMHERWSKYIQNDPCYNPNMTRTYADFTPRTSPLWIGP